MGKGFESLLNRVKKKIRPSKKEIEFINKSKEEIVSRLKEEVPSDVEIVLCGSVAKGTFLKENRDLDLFLLFGKKYMPQEVKKMGIEWAKKAMKGYKTELNYAQHPYLKVILPKIKADIVPSFKMENKQRIKTAVDRSQLHTVYVNERITGNQRDDVRLLKQFCKNIGVYGATSRVEGFSGYLCELLILHYGSFEKLLGAASRWREPVIDMENLIGAQKAREEFARAAMVVIDPVDGRRNVSAVVSHTSLSRLIVASRKFLKSPSMGHFFAKRKEYSKKQIRDIIRGRGTENIVIWMPPPKLVEDVLWPQLRKTAHAIMHVLQKEELRVFGHYFYADEEDAVILIECMDEKLPKIKHVLGPQVFDRENMEAFEKKHKSALNLHIEHERIVAIEKRRLCSPKEVISYYLKNPRKIGVPAGFLGPVKKRKLADGEFLLKKKSLMYVAADYYLRKI